MRRWGENKPTTTAGRASGPQSSREEDLEIKIAMTLSLSLSLSPPLEMERGTDEGRKKKAKNIIQNERPLTRGDGRHAINGSPRKILRAR